MEEAQVISSSTEDDYLISTINLATPHIPPSQGQHDLLLPVLFQHPGTALQIGVGYGALVYALDDLGYAVHGLDTDLTLWEEARSKLSFPPPIANVARGDIRNTTYTYGRFDLVVADFCGAFRDPTMYDVKMMRHLFNILSDTGILAFNFGVVPKAATAAFRNADAVFPHVAIIPGTQVLLATKYELDLDPDRLIKPEPDWLCSTFNLYGEADLPQDSVQR